MCRVMRDNESQQQEEWGLCRAEVSQILSSAEWSTWGAGRGGNFEVERRPQVGHGGVGRAFLRLPWELLASVGVSGESSDLKDDCLPRAACPGKQGLGIQYIQLLKLPGPQFSPAAELQEVWGMAPA